MEKIVFTDSEGNTINYNVLFTFDMNEKSYVVYSDSYMDIDEEIKVYYGVYENRDISTLKNVELEEEIKIIDNILKDYEEILKNEALNY